MMVDSTKVLCLLIARIEISILGDSLHIFPWTKCEILICHRNEKNDYYYLLLVEMPVFIMEIAFSIVNMTCNRQMCKCFVKI